MDPNDMRKYIQLSTLLKEYLAAVAEARAGRALEERDRDTFLTDVEKAMLARVYVPAA